MYIKEYIKIRDNRLNFPTYIKKFWHVKIKLIKKIKVTWAKLVINMNTRSMIFSICIFTYMKTFSMVLMLFWCFDVSLMQLTISFTKNIISKLITVYQLKIFKRSRKVWADLWQHLNQKRIFTFTDQSNDFE